MMAGAHPDDAVLLAYVEGELGEETRASVEVHLAACARCAEDVELARAGAEALRDSPLLDVEPARIAAGLPERRLPAARPRRRLLTVAAPIAAGLALLAGAVTVGILHGGSSTSGSSGSAGGGAGASESAQDSAAGAQARKSLGKVAGTPREVARELRRQGFDARVREGTVVVRGANRAALESALAKLGTGGVRVRVP